MNTDRFSERFIKSCVANNSFYPNRTPQVGDWFYDRKNKSMDVVSGETVGQVEFDSGWFVYIPDTHDLLRIVVEQIQDEADSKIQISFNGENWMVGVIHGDREDFGIGESVHTAFGIALAHMAIS